MEFLVEFDVTVPEGTPAAEVDQRVRAEAAAAADLAAAGHLVRLWKPPVAPGETKAVGLYRADSGPQLALLRALPLNGWMDTAVTPLEPHPNDPAPARSTARPATNDQVPEPRLTHVYRLIATLGEPQDLGRVTAGHRRIVPLTGGTFSGPELSGTLLPGASADWQIVTPDGTALGDVRMTLRTDDGDLLYVRSRGVRHGSSW
jgi:muconolactone D-isomerase